MQHCRRGGGSCPPRPAVCCLTAPVVPDTRPEAFEPHSQIQSTVNLDWPAWPGISRPRSSPSGILARSLLYRQDPEHVPRRPRLRVLRLFSARSLVPGGAGRADMGVRTGASYDVRDVRQPPVPFLSDLGTGRAGGVFFAVLRLCRYVLAPCHAGANPFSDRSHRACSRGGAHRLRVGVEPAPLSVGHRAGDARNRQERTRRMRRRGTPMRTNCPHGRRLESARSEQATHRRA
jgi:hypothetical protein